MLKRVVGPLRSLSRTPTNAGLQPAARMQWARYALGSVAVGTGVWTVKVLLPDQRARQDPRHYYSDWKIRLYTSLPLNALSKLIGFFASIYVPLALRTFLYGWYARTYNCRMDEALYPDFRHYKNFSEFFNRRLLPSSRPISAGPMVSPVDGTVLHIGEIDDNRVEYVKGHDYDVQEFLGPVDIKLKPGKRLLQAVIYLAPGDYHAFHSPVDWEYKQKTHFPGHLLSVRPSVLEKIPLLFCINERTVLNGDWRHGFFSMTAVAATNVGDIYIEPAQLDSPGARHIDTEDHETSYGKSTKYRPGDKIGEFRLGSTVVLIFEASQTAKFAVSAGDHVKLGQSFLIEE